MKVKSESEFTQSCPTLSDPMDCSLPGSSIHGIFQARVLEWGAIAFSASKASLGKILLQNHSELRGQNSVPWSFRIQDFSFMVSVSLWPHSALTACSQVLGTWGSQYSYILKAKKALQENNIKTIYAKKKRLYMQSPLVYSLD